MEYRLAELRRWHEADEIRRTSPDRADDKLIDEVASAAAAHQARTAARAAYFRMRLLWDDDKVIQCADKILEMATELEKVVDRSDLRKQSEAILQGIGSLADLARTRTAQSSSAKKKDAR